MYIFYLCLKRLWARGHDPQYPTYNEAIREIHTWIQSTSVTICGLRVGTKIFSSKETFRSVSVPDHVDVPLPRKSGTVESTVKKSSAEEAQIANLNGSDIVHCESAETEFEEVLILHSKNNRIALNKKSCLALIAAAMEKHEDSYLKARMLGTSDSEAKLDDCHNINKAIVNVAEWHSTYNMHNVFSIVIPMDDGKHLKKDEVYNPYTNFVFVTLEMVAASNTWYNTWHQGPTWKENLAWTDSFFKTTFSPELGEKVNEVYSTFPNQACGGPLLSAMMMHQIRSQTEEAVIA